MSEYQLGDKVSVTGSVCPTYVDKDVPDKVPGVSPEWEEIKALPSIPQHRRFSIPGAGVWRVSVRVLEKRQTDVTVGVIMGIRYLKEGIHVPTLGSEPNYLEQRESVKVYLVSTNLYRKPIYCLPEQVDRLGEH